MELPRFSESRSLRTVSAGRVRPTVSILSLYKSELPEKAGWLQKKSTSLIKRWQWRYVVLKDKILYYYHQEGSSQPACTINFSQVAVNVQVVDADDPRKLIIYPLGSNRVFKLRTQEPQELIEWAIAIHKHLKAAREISVDKGNVGIQTQFWKFPHISNAHFKEMVHTGDILLFTSKTLLSKIQRGVIRSKYDHVALLLRYSSGRIGIFEATGQDGIAIVMWDQFLSYNWHLLYSRLVYRHLEFERDESFLQKIQEFIQVAKGKKYRLSMNKLLFKKKQTEQTEKSYFCSELIARAYQYVGLLPEEIPPWKYLPGRFADEKEFPLIGGSLGKLELIDFDLD